MGMDTEEDVIYSAYGFCPRALIAFPNPTIITLVPFLLSHLQFYSVGLFRLSSVIKLNFFLKKIEELFIDNNEHLGNTII